MSFEYVSVEEAIAKPGLRMVVVGGIPSPWSEAAKGIFAIKKIDWTATRLVYDDPSLRKWIGGLNAPAVFLNDEPPRTGWAQILLLAERLAPEPSLVPSDAGERAVMMGLCHELLAEGGLCWSRRLHAALTGLSGEGGFSAKVSGYLAKKYGGQSQDAAAAQARVLDLLGLFAARLEASSGDYLLGDTMTAADIYLACSVALFAPLPAEQCAMPPAFREAYEWLNGAMNAALSPVLLKHRERMYGRHLALPLSL